jgi:hypothetical protein
MATAVCGTVEMIEKWRVACADRATGRITGIQESGRGPNRLRDQYSRYRQHNHDHCHVVLVSRLIPALFGRFVIATLSGWFFLFLGLFRMFAAGLYQRGSTNVSSSIFMALEAIFLVAGLIMTFKSYSRTGG